MHEHDITLYCREGSSDKVYQVWIEASDEGHRVAFRYGRRGAALQTGTKTPAPVTPDKAKAIFDKIVKEKLAKGYKPADAGEAAAAQADARATDVRPQLLNPIEPSELAHYITSASWFMQVKYDGERRLIRVTAEGVTGINRRGLTVALTQPIADAARGIAGGQPILLDGEDMGDHFVAFDVVEHAGHDCRSRSAYERFALLEQLLAQAGAEQAIRLADTAFSAHDKRYLVERTARDGGEGVVLKAALSAYKPGRPNSAGDALKCKFVASATVRVGAAQTGKRSVAMQLVDDAGTWLDVGNVTVPPNQPIPAPGDLIEVRYLYAYRGGSLFQPVMIGRRTDMTEQDCRIVQLQFKGEAREAA